MASPPRPGSRPRTAPCQRLHVGDRGARPACRRSGGAAAQAACCCSTIAGSPRSRSRSSRRRARSTVCPRRPPPSSRRSESTAGQRRLAGGAARSPATWRVLRSRRGDLDDPGQDRERHLGGRRAPISSPAGVSIASSALADAFAAKLLEHVLPRFALADETHIRQPQLEPARSELSSSRPCAATDQRKVAGGGTTGSRRPSETTTSSALRRGA